jgi:hypothetical protein
MPPPSSSETSSTESTALEAAKSKGLSVALNDSGEIIDQLDLLAPGLNIIPTRPSSSSLHPNGTKSSLASANERYVSRRVGEAASTREIRARQEKALREQMAAEAEREREDRERRERERVGEIKEKRNDESAVMGARERALERKRKREEEAEERRKKGVVDGGRGGEDVIE